MGKGSKRKNPGVGVDFRKVKHKVGKKLPKAQNETRTDFQARSINLPNQSVTQDKAGAAVSERNLTLKELVSQLAHHNTGTRRDALTGLQQLLAAHPAEARRHTALLLESLAPRLSDGEGSVRAALLTTLRTAVLPALGPSALSPFMPLLMAHVSAALTNLSADVRFDALAVLGAVTEAAPQLMGQQQQLGAALAHYTGLLSRANRGKSVKSQALTGLMKVVASLDKFLAAALTAPAGSNSLAAAATAAAAAGDAGSNGSSQSELDEVLLLQGHRAASAPAAAAQVPSAAALLQLYCPAAAGAAVGNSSRPASGRGSSQKQQDATAAAEAAAAAAAGGSDASGSSKPLEQQVLNLLDVLFDCWSEAAPGSLSTAPETESAQVLVHMLSSTQAFMTHFSPTAITTAAESGNGSSSSSFSCLQSAGSTGAICPGFDTRRDQVAWLQDAAGIVLPRLTKAFPVTPPATQGMGVGLFDLLQRFNLLGMQLCAGFMAAGVVWPPPQHQKKHKQQQQQQQQQHWEQQHMDGQQQQQQQEWHTRLLEFMAGVLATGHCLPHLEQATAGAAAAAPSSGKAQSQQQQSSAPGAAPANSSLSSSSILVAVLQSLQQLLPQLVGPARQHILVAVGQLAAAAAAGPRAGSAAAGAGGADSSSGLRALSAAAAGAAGSNAVRSACLGLQLQLLLQHLWRGVPQPTEEADVAAWLSAAPKFLYDLGPNKPRLSQMLLQLLFEAARLSVPGSDIEQQLQGLQPQLAALLVTALPLQAAAAASKPNKQQQQAAGASSQAVRVLVGPLAELPPACQHTAFDTLAHLSQLTPPLLKAVALSCRIPLYPDAAVQRLLDGVLSAASSSMAPDVFVSFAATLLSPGPAAGYLDRASKRQVAAGYGRHQQTVDAVCRWLHCYGPVQDLLPLLAGPLLQQQQQQQGPAAQESPQQACCLAYSLAALAALAAGCWVPSSGSAAAAAGTDVAATGLDGARTGMPPELLSALPGVLAALCLHRAAVTGSADAFAAEAAVEQSLRQLVLPLVCTLPCDSLLLPFMRQMVQQGLVQQQQLRVVLQLLRVLLGCQGLRLVWVQHEGAVRPLLQQVEAAARQLAEQSGEGTALAAAEQLLTGLAVMCA